LLFTLVMDYDGGTYISQGTGESIMDGFISSINNQCISEIPEFSSSFNSEIISQVIDDGHVNVAGVTNVYCSSCEVGGKLAILNLIATAKT